VWCKYGCQWRRLVLAENILTDVCTEAAASAAARLYSTGSASKRLAAPHYAPPQSVHMHEMRLVFIDRLRRE